MSVYPYALPPDMPEIESPDVNRVESAFLKGRHQLRDRRDQYIARQYIRPLLDDPQDHRRRMELGHALIQSGDYNGAIAALTPLLATSLRAEAFYNIGCAYAGQGDLASAADYVGKALDQDPWSLRYDQGLRVLRAEQGEAAR